MSINDDKQLTKRFFDYAKEIDIDEIGIAGVNELNTHGKVGRRPVDIMPSARAIIVSVFGFLDPYSKLWASPQDDPRMQTSVSNNIMLIRTLKLKRFLQKNGYLTYGFEDSPGLFNTHLRMAHAFQQAGLGYVGKSNLAISPKYGSRIRLFTLLTEAPLTPSEKFDKDLCGDCKICQEYCTSTAIMGDGYYNGRLCESVINSKGSNLYFSLTLWYGCDMCCRMCPQGKYHWPKEDCRGDWWDIVKRNREDPISINSIYL